MPEELPLRFRLPEIEEDDVYVVILPDGRRVYRTKEELEEIKEEEER